MKSIFRKSLVVISLVAAGTLSVGAFAESGQNTQEHHAKWKSHHEKHLAKLKTKLNIQSNQEAAWNAFAASMKPADRPKVDRKKMRDEYAAMTTPQRIDKMQAMGEKRREMMRQRADAVKAFYAQLSPEQQKTFDKETLRHMRGMGGMRGHMGGHMGDHKGGHEGMHHDHDGKDGKKEGNAPAATK